MKTLVRSDNEGFWIADDVFYFLEDLEWACEPMDDYDPGITRPKIGAVPRYRDGTPIE